MPPSRVRLRFLGITFLATNAIAVVLWGSDEKSIALRDFFRPPRLSSATISPTGEFIAGLAASDDDRTGVFFYDITKKASRRLRPGADRDAADIAWLDSSKVIFKMIEKQRWALGLLVADARTKDEPLCINFNDAAEFIAAPREDPLKPIIWLRQSHERGGKEDGLIQLDVTTGIPENRKISLSYSGGPFNTFANVSPSGMMPHLPAPKDPAIGYFADRLGKIAYAITSRSGVPELHYFHGQKWEKCPVTVDDTNIFGIAESPEELVVLGPRRPEQPRALQRLNARLGQFGSVLYEDPKFDLDISHLHQRDTTGEILGFNDARTSSGTIWLDADLRALQANVEQTMPPGVVRCVGFDRAEKHFVFEHLSDRHPGTFYLFDRDKAELTLLANVAPWINLEQMRPTQLVHFKTRDGLELDGLLTLPSLTKSQQRPPLIVIPATGPSDTLFWGWNAETQFLAHRGYAVFRPNHRAAFAHRWKSPVGIEWDFRKLHEDITDGVRALQRSDVINPERIAIMGWEFGAYLAFCGAIYEPGLYRCVLGINGVYDWNEVLRETKYDVHYQFAHDYTRRFVGDTNAAIDKFSVIAPLRQAAHFTAPVFIGRGEDDLGLTSAEQSKRLVNVLKAHHAVVEVVVAAGSDPAFLELKSRLKVEAGIERFLGRYLTSRN